MEAIRNKVAESGIITLDLETFYPNEAIMLLDIKDFLFRGMILREKEFREALKNKDWQQYAGKAVGIICSADAIIPMWAYMLLVSYLQPVAVFAGTGDEEEIRKQMLLLNLNKINTGDYADARVVIKGCGDMAIGNFAYAEISRILLPVVKNLMYGEPCSTVPVYKRK